LIVIIGIGNTLRRDDGAGWFFAETLAAELQRAGLGVQLELCQQLTPELAAEIAELQPTAVIFVDASAVVENASLTALPDAATSAAPASHSLTPAALLAIMRRLYMVDVAGWLVQTPAQDFGHGEQLSETAQRGLAAAPAIAAAFLAGAAVDSFPPR
jgi:hydrogenase maturation protease